MWKMCDHRHEFYTSSSVWSSNICERSKHARLNLNAIINVAFSIQCSFRVFHTEWAVALLSSASSFRHFFS